MTSIIIALISLPFFILLISGIISVTDEFRNVEKRDTYEDLLKKYNPSLKEHNDYFLTEREIIEGLTSLRISGSYKIIEEFINIEHDGIIFKNIEKVYNTDFYKLYNKIEKPPIEVISKNPSLRTLIENIFVSKWYLKLLIFNTVKTRRVLEEEKNRREKEREEELEKLKKAVRTSDYQKFKELQGAITLEDSQGKLSLAKEKGTITIPPL